MICAVRTPFAAPPKLYDLLHDGSVREGRQALEDLGQILAQLPLNEAGYLDARVPMATAKTLYARTGDWPVALLYLLVILGLVARRFAFRH